MATALRVFFRPSRVCTVTWVCSSSWAATPGCIWTDCWTWNWPWLAVCGAALLTGIGTGGGGGAGRGWARLVTGALFGGGGGVPLTLIVPTSLAGRYPRVPAKLATSGRAPGCSGAVTPAQTWPLPSVVPAPTCFEARL